MPVANPVVGVIVSTAELLEAQVLRSVTFCCVPSEKDATTEYWRLAPVMSGVGTETIDTLSTVGRNVAFTTWFAFTPALLKRHDALVVAVVHPAQLTNSPVGDDGDGTASSVTSNDVL